jgi:hypothetical protein
MFNADDTQNTVNQYAVIRLRDVLWVRRSLTMALFYLTNPENWIAPNQDALNRAVDYGNELFESLQFMPIVNIGTITLYSFALPDDVILCDGRLVSVVVYPELFDVIGYTYGTGDYGAFFRVPDLSGITLPDGVSYGIQA